MRITKNQAEKVARELLSKKREAIENAEKELKTFVSDIAIKSVPTEVMEFAKKHREYFNFDDSIRLFVSGSDLKDWEYYSIEKSIPMLYGKNYFVPVAESEYKIFEKKKSKIERMDDEYGQSLQKISNAIYNLKTPARLAKEFPEAAAFLPEANQTTALAVNIDSIRDLLK